MMVKVFARSKVVKHDPNLKVVAPHVSYNTKNFDNNIFTY